jgi:hypothetical protein
MHDPTTPGTPVKQPTGGDAGPKEPTSEREAARRTIDSMVPGAAPKPRRSVPTTIVNLPGGGGAVIREISDSAERILATPALQETDEAHELWLCECIESLNGKGNVTPADTIPLLTGDRSYLDVRIVQFTYGDEISYDSGCPNCGETNPLFSNLAEVINTSKPYPEQREFSVVLPSGRTAVIGYLTGLHERAIRAKKKEASLLDAVALRLKALDGHPAQSQTMGELEPKDRAALRLEMSKSPGGGPDTTVIGKCKRCKRPFVTTMEMCMSFFLPGLRSS